MEFWQELEKNWGLKLYNFKKLTANSQIISNVLRLKFADLRFFLFLNRLKQFPRQRSNHAFQFHIQKHS